MRKLFTYLLRLTYNPYEEIPQPNPNETLDAYILRSSKATIHIDIQSQKRTTLCHNAWNNNRKQRAKEVFIDIYNKHQQTVN
jgi:hypothetical protein